MWFGKIYQQNLHNWGHYWSYPKWFYRRDAEWFDWYTFYKALHNNLPSEKIVSFIYYNIGYGDGHQIWGI